MSAPADAYGFLSNGFLAVELVGVGQWGCSVFEWFWKSLTQYHTLENESLGFRLVFGESTEDLR